MNIRPFKFSAALVLLYFPVFSESSDLRTVDEVTCVAKVFDYQYCLGGALSDFEENRREVLLGRLPTTKLQDGIDDAVLYDFESTSGSTTITTHVVVDRDMVVKVARMWNVPYSQLTEIQQQLGKKYHPIALGNPLSFGKIPTDSRYDDGSTNEMVWQQKGYKIKLLKGTTNGVIFVLSPIDWARRTK